ncbi:PREDICTED: uncharacterized protein LOC105458522 isoform X2 [Wasmannia auropunctata]|uniref:uncharacterized protein LOC105458522 isoform X2 n=1 Tax=Wasmannia auropunctata TaxID=64793 RepID=UPI0005EF1106|nr:PREDICTED: uncharacterized protein LOC105458522 isoform X2 [Wasmannia auropunctata]
MTENQLYTFRENEQSSSINPCECANQYTVFDLEKYGPYLDKIRALFVSSLEHRVQSLLEEFVYSTNSRWAKQFPCFKKFVNVIIMWKDPLNRVAEYDINMIEEIMRNIVKRMIKDDLINCFLDSVILHQRLSKVCHELDALGINDNILRNLNVWEFVNEQGYLDHNCFTNFNTAMECNTVSCNRKKSIRCKKAIKPLAKNVYDKNTERIRPTTSKYREHQVLDLNRNFLQQEEDNSNHYSMCVTNGSQNDSTNKINKSFNEKSCNTESKKIRNDLKLKIIVHKVYLRDYKYSTFSSFNVTRLPLPCKPSNLIRQIFEADPFLTESCLIVMKRKFEDSMYNVCSCLNSVLEKLDNKLTKALCLNCEIYPGYISFKLKVNNIKKYFFVARVSICQNVHKCTIQQDLSILSSNSKSSNKINESKCFKNNDTNFNDAFGHADEEIKKLDTHYSQSDRSSIKDMAIDTSQNEAGNINEKRITCMVNENVSRYFQNLAIFSHNNSCKDTVEEISNMTSYVDNSEERNKEYCKVSNSIGINCDECDDMEKDKKKIFESSNSIIKSDTFTELVNNANCTCLSYENIIDINNGIKDIFGNKELDNFSQTTSINEYDWTRSSSDKKSNLENELCNRCSITSFAQNSEYDKQLVELNCNRFSNNNINIIDKNFDMQENNSLLSSTKVEIGCKCINSYCSCRCEDFVDIAVIDNSSKENIVCACETSQNNFDTVKSQNTDCSKTVQILPSRSNNLLTISVHMPRSKVLSKEINVDTCHSQTIWLTSDNDKNISTLMERSDGCNKIANLSTHTLISKTKNKNIPYENKEILDVKDETHDFITSPERFFASKERFRFNGDSRNSGISTGEYLRAENHSTCATSNVSLYCHSFAATSEFTMSGRQDGFQKSKLRECKCTKSRNGIRNVTSTMIKHRTASRRYPNDYSAEIRPQTILAMTKFRNSVDKSIDRIKDLIREKLGRILFNNKINNNNKMIKNFWKNKEFSKDTRRKKTNDKYTRQVYFFLKDYSITSCSTCDCRRQGYTTSSRESSNIILSISTIQKRRRKRNINNCNYKLTDSNKALLSFRSIKTSPSYDSLTSITKDIKKQKLNRNNRSQYDRKEKIDNIINCNRNSHRYKLKKSRTSVTISSQSTKVSLTENESNYSGHYTCKQQNKTCENKRICKQVHNQDQRKNEQVQQECEQYGNKNKYRDVSIKYSNVNSNESLKTSLSYTWRGNARNVYKQFYDISELKNVKRFVGSRKNGQIFEKDMSNHSDDNLRKRHVFAILTDVYNDYMDDFDLNFKLKLLRYVELCKSIKHLLMRTLQPNDIYEAFVGTSG